MADVMNAGLSYAARGYPVFPVRLGGKEPLTHHGFKDATTDLAQILAWSDTWARANIGIATGEASGLVVIDVDEPSGGLATLKEWEAAHGPLPATPTATTPRGGLHFYFQAPPGVDIRSRAGVAPGIDVRASGGFIVAPPSVGANGVRYKWRDGLDLAHPLAPLPEFLLRILLSRKPPVSAPDALRVGQRHDTLVRRAGALRAHGDDEPAILAELNALNQRAVSPLPAKEVGDIARRAGTLPPGPFPMSDLGNAQRFQLLHGRDLLYDYTRGAWRKWDGARWTLDMNGEAERRAQLVARAIYGEVQSEPDSDRRKRLALWAFLSESHSRIEAMLKQARPRLPAPERFDADPWLLNVRNGTLDLRTGTLREHRREDFISRVAPVDFDSSATSPTWDAGVLRIMGGDEAKVRYLHRVFGSCLTGITRDQVLFLLYGRGGNWKSTIIETVRAILGNYAGTVRTDALFERGGSGPSEDVARLDGLLMVTAIESGEGRRLHEALVKSLTGGDRISARFAYGHAFEYDPQFKLILATNHKPRVSDDPAMWRRLRLVEFPVRFAAPGEPADGPAQPRDVNVRARLQSEASGILNRLVEGCLEWQRIGLAEPATVREATMGYRIEESPLREFVEETFERDPAGAVLSSELRSAYESWAARNELEALEPRPLARALRDLGLEQFKGAKGIRMWRGVRWRTGGAGGGGGALRQDFSSLRTREEVPDSNATAPPPATLADFAAERER